MSKIQKSKIKVVVFDYEGVINRWLRLRPLVLELAKELRDGGYKTAVLSNMIKPIAWYLKRRGDFKDFLPVIISSDVGCSKPRLQIYKILLEELNVKADEVLFIDNHRRNLKPAAKLGMKTIHARSTKSTVSEIRKVLYGKSE